MARSYEITSEQEKEIAAARKKNRDKQVEKRLHAVQLRYEGKNNKEIARQLDTSSDIVGSMLQ